MSTMAATSILKNKTYCFILETGSDIEDPRHFSRVDHMFDCLREAKVEGVMIGTARQAKLLVLFSLPMFLSLAVAQTGGNPGSNSQWDPIHGWTDGNPARADSIRSSSSGSAPSSLWSSYQRTNTDVYGVAGERPGTIGGIVISGGSRRCGGMFRMTEC